MNIIDNGMLFRQFGAAIDMLGEALRDCPDQLWEERLWEDQADQWVASGFSAFWYLGLHALFWLDLYLTGAEQGFAPPEPFDLVEMQAHESLPRTYTRDELIVYLEYCQDKCKQTISAMSSEEGARLCRFGWGSCLLPSFSFTTCVTSRSTERSCGCSSGSRRENPAIGRRAPSEQLRG